VRTALYNWNINIYHKNDTFSVVLHAVAAAFDDAIPLATRRVLFGLLFMSFTEDEGAGIVTLQPLLVLLTPAAGCNDDDTAICLPGEAKNKPHCNIKYNCNYNINKESIIQ